jgi:hypothetical protein
MVFPECQGDGPAQRRFRGAGNPGIDHRATRFAATHGHIPDAMVEMPENTG